MNRDEILDTLRAHKPVLAERFGVSGLALFGSFARGQATELSDVDILVTFDRPATSKSYFGVQFYIEDLLGLLPSPTSGCSSTSKTCWGDGLTW